MSVLVKRTKYLSRYKPLCGKLPTQSVRIVVFILRIMFTVYMHIFPNNKVYVGITSQKTQERWRNNGDGYKNQILLYRAIQKYGWDNIKHEIIAENLTAEQAQKLEIELIKKYDSTNKDKGYNISLGGEASAYGMRHSEETKRKFSENRIGEKNSFFGKHHTEETRKKLSEMRSGENAYFYGKKRGFQKMHEWHEKALICIENNTIYKSTVEAGEKLNIPHRSIARVCRNERPITHGLHFRYLTEQEKCQFLQSKTN